MMVEFSGVVKHSRAHYRKGTDYSFAIEDGWKDTFHEEYTWQPGDVSFWKVRPGVVEDGVAYISEGRRWSFSAELSKLKEALMIEEFNEADAERFATALRGFDLDTFTMEKWYDAPPMKNRKGKIIEQVKLEPIENPFVGIF